MSTQLQNVYHSVSCRLSRMNALLIPRTAITQSHASPLEIITNVFQLTEQIVLARSFPAVIGM
jgi:hypothetical protein